jgi:hypothetical protein
MYYFHGICFCLIKNFLTLFVQTVSSLDGRRRVRWFCLLSLKKIKFILIKRKTMRGKTSERLTIIQN